VFFTIRKSLIIAAIHCYIIKKPLIKRKTKEKYMSTFLNRSYYTMGTGSLLVLLVAFIAIDAINIETTQKSVHFRGIMISSHISEQDFRVLES